MSLLISNRVRVKELLPIAEQWFVIAEKVSASPLWQEAWRIERALTGKLEKALRSGVATPEYLKELDDKRYEANKARCFIETTPMRLHLHLTYLQQFERRADLEPKTEDIRKVGAFILELESHPLMKIVTKPEFDPWDKEQAFGWLVEEPENA